jgi:hypothetical protein
MLKYENIDKIEIKDTFIKKIGYKPYSAHIICLLATIALIATLNKGAIIFGVLLLTLNMTSFIFVKDHPTLSIFDKGVLVYDPNDPNKACYITYDDIASWTSKKDKNQMPSIYFKLTNNTEIYISTSQSNKAFHLLNKYIEDKEINHQQGRTISSLFNNKK